MRFGSVEFFKVLIKTVLAIFFFVPLAAAVVFGVFWARQNSELDRLKEENASIVQDNDRLTVVADVLVGEKVGGAADMRDIMKRSGTDYEEFIALLLTEKEIDTQRIYEILSAVGVTDKEIIMIAASGNTVDCEGFFDIMSKNGITAAELAKTALRNGSFTDADLYKLLSDSGMSDKAIIDLIENKGSGGSTSKPSTSNGTSGGAADSSPESSKPESSPYDPDEDSPYAELYQDMYVPTPEEYSFEEGTIYLTFDDGPSSNTHMLLDYLKKFGIKATWFVVPDGSDWSMELLKEISDAGHVVAVHSRTHEYTDIYASVEAFLDDFYQAWSIIREATGKTPQIFRFPGGSNNDYNVDTREAIIKEMTRRGFRFFDWNVDSGDVMGATWQDMYNSIPSSCYNVRRPVILMHDSKNTYNTVLVLEDVLKTLVDAGYKFDSINENTEPVQFVGPFA